MINMRALKGLALGMAFPFLLGALGRPTPTAPAVAVVERAPGLGFSGGSPLVIPAAAFSSDGMDPDAYTFWFSTGVIEGDGSTTACLKAPAYLPQWATVYQVWASIYDNSVDNVLVTLRRVDNYSGIVTEMAALGSSGASTTMQTPADYSIVEPGVSYPDSSYYTTVCLYNSNTRLYSVRVWFEEHDIYLPLIMR